MRSETTNDNVHWQPHRIFIWLEMIVSLNSLKFTCMYESIVLFKCCKCKGTFSFSSRHKPSEESEVSSQESPDTSSISPTNWLTSSPVDTDLEESESVPGLDEEELPHMLLPDSLSQLEEFGRHKRPRKAHRGHGRPRLFSDLWVRIGDRYELYTLSTKNAYLRVR